ncbi:hypothetical protein PV04_01851 [Phialophora macrospora]|uniref:Transcription factor domain-containing protein n=1 Tax=Phialophora macrospora TaxID=1851006 RepID=A0A0D2FYY3_9EURO|nr:hypothetical protein PV04_01851 [Phialophora macrospora]
MFITYNDLDDMRDSRKRSQINAHVNRSRKVNKVRAAQQQARAVQWQSRQPIRSATPLKTESGASTPGAGLVDARRTRVSTEVIITLLEKRRLPRLGLQYGLGGFRNDPFASLPVRQTEQVEWATDFFTQTFSAMNASLYTDDAGNWLLKTLFPMALQSDMLFQALILSMARFSHPASKDALIPGGVHFAHLRSSVLSKLHRTLSMDKAISTSDTTIHTVICLIAADFFAGHDDHAAIHLKGLQTLVSLRGGLENGNFDRYTKYNLAGTHALCQFAEQRLRESNSPPVMVEPELTYPSHPFSPQLCTDIAVLPLGLSEIALEGRISVQVIELLCRISQMAQETPLTKRATTEQIYNAAIDLMTYITRDSISPLERSICLFTFVFMLRETPSRNESQKFYGQFLNNLRRRFQQTSKSFMSLDGVGPDLAIWGVAMLAMENSLERIGLDESERSDRFEQLLRQHRKAANWKQTCKSLKDFFFLDTWIEEYRVWWNKEMEKFRKRH